MKNQIKLFGKAYTIVSEAEQKDMSNTLYLYAETINGMLVYLKFGEAFKAVYMAQIQSNRMYTA